MINFLNWKLNSKNGFTGQRTKSGRFLPAWISGKRSQVVDPTRVRWGSGLIPWPKLPRTHKSMLRVRYTQLHRQHQAVSRPHSDSLWGFHGPRNPRRGKLVCAVVAGAALPAQGCHCWQSWANHWSPEIRGETPQVLEQADAAWEYEKVARPLDLFEVHYRHTWHAVPGAPSHGDLRIQIVRYPLHPTHLRLGLHAQKRWNVCIFLFKSYQRSS